MTKILRAERKSLPPIYGEQGIVYTHRAKAKAFAKCFKLHCSPNQKHADVDYVGAIYRAVRRTLRDSENIEMITLTSLGKIKEIIKYLRVKKAPENDSISNKMIKQLPHLAVIAIIIAMLKLQYFLEK